MVQFSTGRINGLCAILLYTTACSADIFSDAWNDVKSAAGKVDNVASDAWRDVESTAKDAAKFIKDRFKDTKATRAADYAARKAAFEAALRTAQATLTLAEKTTEGILKGAEQTAQGAITASDAFLAEVVQKASPAILEGSAAAASGILEGAKAASVGTLQGTRWVVTNVIGQFDINRLRYENSLRALASGTFGNVLCEGIMLGKDFSIRFDLDPRDLASVTSSIKPILNAAEKFFNSSIGQPFQQKSKQIQDNKIKVDEIATAVDRPLPPDIAVEQEQLATQAVAALTTAELALIDQLKKVTSELNAIAKKRDSELRDLVKVQGKTGVASRQEIVRRATTKSR